MMIVIAILIPFLIVAFLLAAGMYEGFSAWALDEAERRTEKLYKQYIDETKFVIEQTVRVEFVDETEKKPEHIQDVKDETYHVVPPVFRSHS